MPDIRHAIAWYEKEKPGLGKKFNLSLNTTLQRILKSPFQFPVIFEDLRKARLPRPFPYKLIYMVLDEEVYIIALAHDSRDPEMWKERH